MRRVDSSEHSCEASTHAPRAVLAVSRGARTRGARTRATRDGPVVRPHRNTKYETVLERERRHLLAPLPGLVLGVVGLVIADDGVDDPIGEPLHHRRPVLLAAQRGPDLGVRIEARQASTRLLDRDCERFTIGREDVDQTEMSCGPGIHQLSGEREASSSAGSALGSVRQAFHSQSTGSDSPVSAWTLACTCAAWVRLLPAVKISVCHARAPSSVLTT